MEVNNHHEKRLKMSVLHLLLLLCAGVCFAEVLITSEQFNNIERRLRVTEETLKELKRENEALRLLTKASSDKLESIEIENQATKIAFSAGLLSSGYKQFGPFETPSTLIYQKVFTNFGNGYDSNSGIFKAPLKGVYFFRFYAHAHPSNQMGVSLLKNNQVQCSVFSLQHESNANASNGVVLSLEKGDEVFTQLRKNSWVFDDDLSYTSFGGFLLFPL